MTVQIITTRYQPGTALDDELATLGYAAMRGWPDQRPVTGALVRSRLRPSGGTGPATSLILARTPAGNLAGAAALRHPAVPGTPARLWGPVIAPEWQRGGIGTRLLAHAQAFWVDRDTTVLTAEIPASRGHGCRLFERAGWARRPGAVLLKGDITDTRDRGLAVRPLEPEDSAALADLYLAINPGHGQAVADDTYRRWSADERFVADGLLVIDGPGAALAAATLVYPLIHATCGEPAEVLVADVLVHPGADRAAVAGPLIAAGIAAGAKHGALVARAIVPYTDRPLIGDLRRAGLDPVAETVYYQAPPAVAAPCEEVSCASAR
ncbi:N-acetyltransferase family protein [Planotetraspora sp. GP83]|uniref:GNAT family N-acetyltransferase n=1 Tax=Planotetraspora sp. GP83 TaxID=3156264 RepID=UPI0035190810